MLLLVGCALEFQPQTDWTDQLVADGPCYDANLFDGLDTGSTEEAHQVFACLNQTGTLDSLRPLDAALDAPTRGAVIGLELAAWSTVAPAHLPELSLSSLLDSAEALLDDRDRLTWWADLGVEATYGVAAADAPDLAAPAAPGALDAGLLVPALPLVQALSTTLLDAPPLRMWLADALRGDQAARIAWTVAAIPASSAAPIADIADGWPNDLADTIRRVSDTTNNRSAGATGNSLRDLGVLLVDPAVASGIGARLRPIVEDEVAIARIRGALALGVSSGWIEPLPGQALRLATEDVDGGTLGTGESSALLSLLRLLARANQPADCSIDLGITSIDFSLGNLAVTLLEQLAALDPDTAIDGVELLSTVLGYDLTDSVLGTIADTGVCPAIDSQLVEDLGAIDRLNNTPELLHLLITLLGALDDHITDVADLVTTVYSAGLVPPIEELLLDVGDAPVMTDLTTMVPALLEPSGWFDLDELPAGADVLELEDAVDLVTTALADWDTLRPGLVVLLDADATWTVADHAATLLEDPESEARTLLDAFSEWCFAHPDADVRGPLADLLADDVVTEPLLRIAEAPGLSTAIGSTAPDAEGPLPFVARLHLGGTLTVLLDTLDLVRGLLRE